MLSILCAALKTECLFSLVLPPSQSGNFINRNSSYPRTRSVSDTSILCKCFSVEFSFGNVSEGGALHIWCCCTKSAR